MLNTSQLLKRITRRLGYEKIKSGVISRDDFFSLYFGLKKPFVLQIGANDGKTHDSLHVHISHNDLPGLLVEPQPDIFLRLKENYSQNTKLKFANVAIGTTDGLLPFYRINPDLVIEGKEYKASSGSSFYREQIVGNVKNRLPPMRHDVLKFVSNNPDDYIVETNVQVLSLQSLLAKYNVNTIDFMLLDCQGHDYEILKQIDFTRFRPDIINYEHMLLSGADVVASRELLRSHGYRYFVHEGDTCAYLSDIVWRQ